MIFFFKFLVTFSQSEEWITTKKKVQNVFKTKYLILEKKKPPLLIAESYDEQFWFFINIILFMNYAFILHFKSTLNIYN